MQKQREYFAKPVATSSSTARSTINGLAPSPDSTSSSPATTRRKFARAPSNNSHATPAYHSLPVPCGAKRPRNAGARIVNVRIDYPDNPDADVEVRMSNPRQQLPFTAGGFGRTEQEALLDFYECYLDMRILVMQEGRPVPEIRFRFVRHKHKDSGTH